MKNIEHHDQRFTQSHPDPVYRRIIIKPFLLHHHLHHHIIIFIYSLRCQYQVLHEMFDLVIDDNKMDLLSAIEKQYQE